MTKISRQSLPKMDLFGAKQQRVSCSTTTMVYRWGRALLLLALGATAGLIVFVGFVKPSSYQCRKIARQKARASTDPNNIVTLFRWMDPIAEQPQIRDIYPNRTDLHDELPSKDYTQTFYTGDDCSSSEYYSCDAFVRALRELGWEKAHEREEARLLFTLGTKDEWFDDAGPRIKSWQRYSHLSTTESWQQTEAFYDAVLGHSTYLPELYRLHEKKERRTFQKILATGTDNPLLITQPWVYEDYEAPHALSILKPLPRKVPDEGYVSRYICHPLLWGPVSRVTPGRKFDIRIFFFVASLDPLLVFYHDGYILTSLYPYEEGDYFSSEEVVQNHLMGFGPFQHDHGKHSFEEFERMLQIETRTRANANLSNLHHVRNQMKEAISQIVSGLRKDAFTMKANANQDGFELFAADFMVDDDLNVWLMRAHNQTQMDDDMYSMLELEHNMYTGMIQILEDVWKKQQASSGRRSILPVVGAGTWELIYVAGDTSDTVYQYSDYNRVKALKHKMSCDPLIEPTKQKLKKRKKKKKKKKHH